jgi:hypothetical protein
LIGYLLSKQQEKTMEQNVLSVSRSKQVHIVEPCERLRAELERICKASPLWDGDVVSLQVTEITDRVAQVRCLASARSAPVAFDLRCEIREQMLAFMRDQCPEALPRDRLSLERNATPPSSPAPG